ncbi:MAG: hypothetical protein AMJ65_15400 [Phycisphaerae bacterium SG8_4]|nr:MAG: hypothetical protein AMJ65_15400 [Phycisphaerae bacterium SG8_4]
MMCGNVFRLQLAAAFADTRRVVLRIGVSVLLAMPFILIDMPARAQAAGIVMVILFTGFFGAATGHTRLRSDLRLGRLMLLPRSRVIIWLDLVMASALTRLAPVAVVLAGFVIVNGQGLRPASLIGLLGLLCACLVLLTLLGMGAGRLSRSNGEVHLFGALICGALALVSGIAPVPERLAWLNSAAAWNPIACLLTALTRLASGPASIPAPEFVFGSLALSVTTIIAVQRWISGGHTKMQKDLTCRNPG